MAVRAAIIVATIASVATATGTEVFIEVNDTASGTDDYLCWSPIAARVRAVTDQRQPVPVVLNSISSTDSAVAFSRVPDAPVSASNYRPSEQLNITLPSDGSWVPILVSGARPSSSGKDVSIRAQSERNGASLGELSVMVRVRKNADKLTTFERELFLEALAQLHGHAQPGGPTGSYQKYADAHTLAFGQGIHYAGQGLPLFLAWHRAFLLSLERELQSIDPRVTIPYWRFDQDSERIFVEHFMGRVTGPSSAQGTLVRFDTNNPLYGWRIPVPVDGQGPLVRYRNAPVRLQAIYSPPRFDTLENIFAAPAAHVYEGDNPSSGANARIENRHHNWAHVHVGGRLNSGRSPDDPLFFLLHANVDRAWARWQARYDRFNPLSPDSYPLQGTYPGPANPNRLRKGSYARDAMWPWSLNDGSETPDDPWDNWPAPGFSFPESPGRLRPCRPSDACEHHRLHEHYWLWRPARCVLRFFALFGQRQMTRSINNRLSLAAFAGLLSCYPTWAVDDQISTHPDPRVVAYYTEHDAQVSALRSTILDADGMARRSALEELALHFPIAAEITARSLVDDPDDQIASIAIQILQGALVMSDHPRDHMTVASPRIQHMLEQHQASRDALRAAVRDKRPHIRMEAASYLASQSDNATLEFVAQDQTGLYSDVEAANIFTLGSTALAQHHLARYLESGNIDAQRTAIGYLGAVPSYQTLIRNRFLLNPEAPETIRIDAARALSAHDPDFAAYALVVTSDPDVSPALHIAALAGYVNARSKTTNLDSLSARVFDKQLDSLSRARAPLPDSVQQDLDHLRQRLAAADDGRSR